MKENRKLYIHKKTGQIVEVGKCQIYICPGIVREDPYVKYGMHGSQRKVGYTVGKDYKYIGLV